MAESSACSLSAFEAEASASSSAAVLYSGQLRSLLAFPGIADNHVRFFNGLFGSRQAWDAFFFVDVGDAAGDVDGVACDSRGLAPVMRALAPVAVQTWAPRRDGDVPIVRVAGYCEQGATDRRGCLTKNETDRFNKAYSNIKTRPEAVARIMRLKHHIYRAFELMSKHVDKRRGGQRYDLVARVRPDCWFDNQLTARGYDPFVEMTPLSPSVLNALARARVLVAPREWSWGGLNDRFAVGGFREMKLYADQYMHMQRGWPSAVAADGNERAQDCPGWIHSESFARCNLVRHGITFAQVPLGIFLVRADGRMQVLGHMEEGGLHSCSCITWQMQGAHGRSGAAATARPVPALKPIPEWNYVERCGKHLNLSVIGHDPAWTATAFAGNAWKYYEEKPCRGARWWRGGITTGHHEWGS